MSWAHIHLALNHVPVVGLPIVILVLLAALVRRSTELAKAGFALLVLIAAATIIVQLTGESAEELVENLPGYSESLVERHEELALVATIGMSVVGLAALFGLVRFRGDGAVPTWYGGSVLVLALVVAALMGWTAYLGGQIRHSEIRPVGIASELHYPPRASRTAAATRATPSSALIRATQAARPRRAMASPLEGAA